MTALGQVRRARRREAEHVQDFVQSHELEETRRLRCDREGLVHAAGSGADIDGGDVAVRRELLRAAGFADRLAFGVELLPGDGAAFAEADAFGPGDEHFAAGVHRDGGMGEVSAWLLS